MAHSTLVIPPLCVLALGLGAAAAQTDPLTDYLVSRGFSNVPYTDQLRVAAGGYVAYDTENKDFPPVWEGPVEGENPVLLRNVPDIEVPEETMKRLRSLKFDAKLFGVDPTVGLQSGGQMDYGAMTLKPSALRDTNAVYDLLKPGSPLEKEFLEYGGNGSRVYSNQHLYAILTVYYSTGVTITSSQYIGVTGSSGSELTACPTSIPATPTTPAGSSGQVPAAAQGSVQPGAGQAPASATPSTAPAATPSTPAVPTTTTASAVTASGGAQPSPQSAGQIGAAAARAALIAAGQAAGTTAGEAITGKGGLTDAKSKGDTAAAAAVKAASGSLPGGGGSYCRLDEKHVVFHPGAPVPIAAQLLRVFVVDDDKWNLLPAIVAFNAQHTKEISH